MVVGPFLQAFSYKTFIFLLKSVLDIKLAQKAILALTMLNVHQLSLLREVSISVDFMEIAMS